MYIPMPSPNGTNKAGLFLPASRFASAAAAYDSKRGLSRHALRAYDQMATSPNSVAPWNLADEREMEKFGIGRRAEDDEDDETNGEGEDPVHEVMRRARAAGLNDCGQLRDILGRLLMVERQQAEEEDKDAEYEASVASRSEDQLPRNAAEGGMGGVADRRRAKDVKRAQDQTCSIADFAQRHPDVARIRNIGGYDAPAIPATARSVITRRNAPAPRIAYDAASDRDFAQRHPEVSRIRVIL
jgi:hypothetical protein